MTTKYRNAAKVAEERILELTEQFKKTVGVATNDATAKESTSPTLKESDAPTPTESDNTSTSGQAATSQSSGLEDAGSADGDAGGKAGTK